MSRARCEGALRLPHLHSLRFESLLLLSRGKRKNRPDARATGAQSANVGLDEEMELLSLLTRLSWQIPRFFALATKSRNSRAGALKFIVAALSRACETFMSLR